MFSLNLYMKDTTTGRNFYQAVTVLLFISLELVRGIENYFILEGHRGGASTSYWFVF